MSERYEINATIPMQIGKGKIADAKDNTKEAQLEDPKTRNEKNGYIEIKTEPTKEIEEETR